MLASIRHAALSALRRRINQFFPPASPQLCLAGINTDPIPASHLPSTDASASPTTPSLEDALWFAVPKRKHSRSRKRMKTTVQKRIKEKENIVIDKRTGELTLKHHLPYNWKNYLPGYAEHTP
ncbi:hypothetical protein ACHAXT_006612 [Thalassiosira profunda]